MIGLNKRPGFVVETNTPSEIQQHAINQQQMSD